MTTTTATAVDCIRGNGKGGVTNDYMDHERVPDNGVYRSDGELGGLPPRAQGGNWGEMSWARNRLKG